MDVFWRAVSTRRDIQSLSITQIEKVFATAKKPYKRKASLPRHNKPFAETNYK